MNTPQNEAEDGWVPVRNDDQRTHEPRGEHWDLFVTGVCGLAIAAVVLLLFYPALVVITQPLHPLSSTALVTIALTAWIGSWLVMELVLEAVLRQVNGSER